MTHWKTALRYARPLFVALGLLTLAPACSDPEEDMPSTPYIPPDSEGNWILVDRIHTNKQSPDLYLHKGDFNYQGMHGYHRIFKFLEKNGYPYRQIFYDTAQDTRITREILSEYKVFFINLVSSDNPDFTADEITAIQEWTEEGGGLFIIADHTNVYYHAERINPILAPMGIEVTYHTAADRAPDFAINSYWTKIRNWVDHPVTRGVKVASFQTGGPMTGHAVGTLSDQGWGDFWDNSDPENIGFYGDGVLDDSEPTGRLGVVSAAQYGEGRVVVVGDQNIFGDEWVYIGNNWELLVNTFEWTAQNEFAETPLREVDLREDHFVVGFDLKHSGWNVGTNGCNGYFPFFINFNRDPEVVARGIEEFDDRQDALVFTDPASAFEAEEIEAVRSYLEAGKTVLLLTDVVRAGAGSRQLLQAFAPDLQFTGVDTFSPENLPVSTGDGGLVTTVTAPQEFPISSPVLSVSGEMLSGHITQGGFDCSPDDSWESYLRDLTATGGSPFIQADLDGKTVDIARTFPVGDGELIVIFQDGFLRNETLGWERHAPTQRHQDAHDVQFTIINYMKARK